MLPKSKAEIKKQKSKILVTTEETDKQELKQNIKGKY